MADLSAWAAYKEITIQADQVDSNLTDFPCLVILDADEDVGGRCLASGNDIRFTLSDGETLLTYERETFAVASGEATGAFWVKIPSISSSTGATIRCYYGNASASDGEDAVNVWDDNFIAVYHLGEASGAAADSTGVYDGTYTGGLPSQRDGKAGYCQYIAGTFPYKYVDILNSVGGTNSLKSIGDDFTVSLWWNQPTVQSSSESAGWRAASTAIELRKEGDPKYPITFNLGVDASKFSFGVWDGDGAANSGRHWGSTTLQNNTWYHAVATIASDDQYAMYLNGSVDSSGGIGSGGDGTRAIGSGTANLQIGCRARDDGQKDRSFFTGYIDEVRISNAERSAAWVKFEHANIDSADNELTWGEEANPEPTAVIPQIIWYN